jgi:hypothetical protein
MELTLACFQTARSSDLKQPCGNGGNPWLERAVLFHLETECNNGAYTTLAEIGHDGNALNARP